MKPFIILMLFLPFCAQAQLYPSHGSEYSYKNYFKAGMGSSTLSDYHDTSGSLEFDENAIVPIQLAYGVSLGVVSFEGELNLNHYEFNYFALDPGYSFMDGDLGVMQVMMNAYLKSRPKGTHVYLGGGVGALSATLEGEEQDLEGSSLAIQAMLGLEASIGDRAGFFLEYRYLKSIGLEMESDFAIIDFDYKQSGLQMGVKFYF